MPDVGKKYSDVDVYLKEVVKAEEELGVEGFIKPGEEAREILFAPRGNCRSWLAIPKDLIQSTEHLGLRICDDPDKGVHEHPYVRLNLDAAKKGAGPVISRLMTAVARS